MGRDGLVITASKLLLNQYVTDRSRFIASSCSALLLVWTLLRLTRKPKQQQIDNMVPTVSGAVPVFGHTFQLSKDPLGFIRKSKAECGPVFSIKLFTRNYYVMTGSMIRELLTAPHKYVSFAEGVESVIPVSRVFSLSYDHKYVDEDTSTPETYFVIHLIKKNLRPHQIDVFSSRIQRAFKEVLDEELQLNPGEKVQIEPGAFLSRTIARISCLCFIGSRVGNNKELIHAMATLTQSIITAGKMLHVLPAWIADMIVRRYFSIEREMDLLMELLVPLINGIRSGEIPNDEVTYISLASMLSKADGSFRSPESIAFHFRTVALASIHTASQYTNFALHELACRPELQKELRNEISKLDQLTPETVNTIALLDSFLREVLRYDMDNLGNHHLTLQDFVLSTGQTIPKGSLIVIAADDAHRDPDLTLQFETSLDEFDAHRFMNVTVDKPSTKVGDDFLPFGLGAHSCPGRYFAVSEIKYVVAELLMKFKISTPSGKRSPDVYVLGTPKYPPKEDIIFEAH
ncbi:cytochrome P450 [Fennellomyces sp. T-0311]|nr:cytochrome P450 [Fennellomyces sp. T-0311]